MNDLISFIGGDGISIIASLTRWIAALGGNPCIYIDSPTMDCELEPAHIEFVGSSASGKYAAGVPYLMDFGIATCHWTAEHSQPFFGVPENFPPEQWDGLAVGPQCDRYPLPGLYYRVLAGAVPFENQMDPQTRSRNLEQGAAPAYVRARKEGIYGDLRTRPGFTLFDPVVTSYNDAVECAHQLIGQPDLLFPNDVFEEIKSKHLWTDWESEVLRSVTAAILAWQRDDVIHRDVKPGNITTHVPGWKIVDFNVTGGRSDGLPVCNTTPLSSVGQCSMLKRLRGWHHRRNLRQLDVSTPDIRISDGQHRFSAIHYIGHSLSDADAPVNGRIENLGEKWLTQAFATCAIPARPTSESRMFPWHLDGASGDTEDLLLEAPYRLLDGNFKWCKSVEHLKSELTRTVEFAAPSVTLPLYRSCLGTSRSAIDGIAFGAALESYYLTNRRSRVPDAKTPEQISELADALYQELWKAIARERAQREADAQACVQRNRFFIPFSWACRDDSSVISVVQKQAPEIFDAAYGSVAGQNQPRFRTANCPCLFRFEAAPNASWTSEELRHIASCPHCQRVRSHFEIPTKSCEDHSTTTGHEGQQLDCSHADGQIN
jgi:hypothetical protein